MFNHEVTKNAIYVWDKVAANILSYIYVPNS